MKHLRIKSICISLYFTFLAPYHQIAKISDPMDYRQIKPRKLSINSAGSWDYDGSCNISFKSVRCMVWIECALENTFYCVGYPLKSGVHFWFAISQSLFTIIWNFSNISTIYLNISKRKPGKHRWESWLMSTRSFEVLVVKS